MWKRSDFKHEAYDMPILAVFPAPFVVYPHPRCSKHPHVRELCRSELCWKAVREADDVEILANNLQEWWYPWAYSHWSNDIYPPDFCWILPNEQCSKCLYHSILVGLSGFPYYYNAHNTFGSIIPELIINQQRFSSHCSKVPIGSFLKVRPRWWRRSAVPKNDICSRRRILHRRGFCIL